MRGHVGAQQGAKGSETDRGWRSGPCPCAPPDELAPWPGHLSPLVPRSALEDTRRQVETRGPSQPPRPVTLRVRHAQGAH